MRSSEESLAKFFTIVFVLKEGGVQRAQFIRTGSPSVHARNIRPMNARTPYFSIVFYPFPSEGLVYKIRSF